MNERVIGKHFLELKTIDSTNSFILQNITTLPQGFLAYCSNQTNSYGTNARKWVCFNGKSFGASVLFKQVDKLFLSSSTKLGCVCILKTLREFNIETVQFKWFNDLTILNKKIGGILGESQICGETINLVLGFGLNLLQNLSDFESNNLPHAGSVFSQTGKKIQTKEFLKKFTHNLNELYLFFKSSPLQASNIINEIYLKNCLIIGKKLKIINNMTQNSFVAVAKQLLQNGNLLVETMRPNKTILELAPEQFSVFFA